MKLLVYALPLFAFVDDASAGTRFQYLSRKSYLGNVPLVSRHHVVNMNSRSLATISASLSGGGSSGSPLVTSGAASSSIPNSSLASSAQDTAVSNYTEVSRGGAGATRVLATEDPAEGATETEAMDEPDESDAETDSAATPATPATTATTAATATTATTATTTPTANTATTTPTATTATLPDVVVSMPQDKKEEKARCKAGGNNEKQRRGLIPFRRRRSAKCIAKKLKNRNAQNIKRKLVHAGFGLSFAMLNHLLPKERFVPGMAILSSATLLMELLRYRKGFHWMNEILHFVLGSSLRKHEMEGKFTGSFYFFTGVTATAALYSKPCATLGIAQLALADPSASYFGRATRHIYWSRIENGLGGFGRNKGILGFLGGALFCVPFNYRVLSIAKLGAENGVIPGGKNALWLASFALGIAGAFADLAVPTPALTMPKKVLGVRVPPLHVDDNFVVPIVSGFACEKVFEYLGWSCNSKLAQYLVI